MRRLAGLVVLPAVIVLGACGGDDGATGAGDWCAYAEQMRDRGDEFDSVDFLDPDALRTSLGELRGVLDQALERAPDEIRSDVELTKAGFDQFYDALEDVDFDVFEADADVFDGFGEGLDDAGERISEYNARVCGFSDDAGDVSEEGSGTIDEPASPRDVPDLDALVDDDTLAELSRSEGFVQMFVEQIANELEAAGFTADEARCVAERYDIDALLTGEIRADDPAMVLDIFEECGIAAGRLAELGG